MWGSGSGIGHALGALPGAHWPRTVACETVPADDSATELPTVGALLAAAVQAVGGTQRAGQILMAEAVARAIHTGEHLAVQAGTGTGKSLAYLVPAIRCAV